MSATLATSRLGRAQDDLLDDIGGNSKEADVESDSSELDEAVDRDERSETNSAAPAEPTPPAPQESTTVDPATLDRIKAVPRKPFLKRGRVETRGLVSTSLNDAYFQHLVAGGAITYFIHDSLGIGVGAEGFIESFETGNLDVVRREYGSILGTFAQPTLMAHLDGQWVPFYGKVSAFGSSITHFDFYLIGGGGIVSALNGTDTAFAANVGIGQRLMFDSWFTTYLELRNTTYMGRQLVDGFEQSKMQNVLLLSLGVGFFLPAGFEYSSQ